MVNSSDGTVSKVDISSDRVVAMMHIGAAPTGIAVGAGRVWVTIQARSQQ